MPASQKNGRRLRLLLVIASYGEKNIEFLRRIIRTYRSMAMESDIIVLSEAPKDLDAGAKVIVGVPTRNPWSLPFTHKKIFAENLDRYDLFAYSEDDMGVTEANIQAFLRVTPALADDEIAGFLRYEVDRSGAVCLPDVHGAYHWKVQTVRQRGAFCVAEFSNEHSAFFLLTQTQLKKAIASGGFMRDPHKGRYDMLCSAATDPYTCCGLRKVICISALEEFLIHHMPNRYAGLVGIQLPEFKGQVQTLLDIRKGVHPVHSLCEVEPKVLHCNNWYKGYYESPDGGLLDMVPKNAHTVLSVGCGWGATEMELQQRGAKVTALPLDSVIGVCAARRGVEVFYGTLAEGLNHVRERQFDCVLMTNLLHLQPDPWSVLTSFSRLVANLGSLVIAGPNFEFLPYLVKGFFGVGDYRKLRDFDQSGMHVQRLGTMRRQIERAGFRIASLRWFNFARPRRMLLLHRWPKRLVARNWVIQARQNGSG